MQPDNISSAMSYSGHCTIKRNLPLSENHNFLNRGNVKHIFKYFLYLRIKCLAYEALNMINMSIWLHKYIPSSLSLKAGDLAKYIFLMRKTWKDLSLNWWWIYFKIAVLLIKLFLTNDSIRNFIFYSEYVSMRILKKSYNPLGFKNVEKLAHTHFYIVLIEIM